jgi:hypothetical protein
LTSTTARQEGLTNLDGGQRGRGGGSICGGGGGGSSNGQSATILLLLLMAVAKTSLPLLPSTAAAVDHDRHCCRG